MQPLQTTQGLAANTLWTLDPSVIHLNNGSYGAVPRAAQAHQQALLREIDRDPDLWFSTMATRVRAAAVDTADFLKINPDQVVLVPNASAAATVVAASYAERRGTEFVLTDHCYGAIRMSIERAARRCGGSVHTAKIPLAATQSEIVDTITAQVTDRTELVVVDQITSPTAQTLPVAQVVDACHRRGARVLIDGAHAPAQFAAPLTDIDFDYWFGNLHKWAGAPRGCAALVVRPELADTLWPIIDSWGTEGNFLQRFDMQGTTDFTPYLTSKVSTDTIEQELGWDRVRNYTRDLLATGAGMIQDALATRFGPQPPLPRPAPMLQIVPLPDPLGTHEELRHAFATELLSQHHIRAAITAHDRAAFVRLSAHAYNTPSDYEAFAHAAPAILSTLLSSQS